MNWEISDLIMVLSRNLSGRTKENHEPPVRLVGLGAGVLHTKKKTTLRGFGPRANYTDRAAAARWRS
jgi:hypothetical protein